MGTLRVKVNGAWVDVVAGMTTRTGFWRRGSTIPSVVTGTVTNMPLDVLLSTGNWQWTISSNIVTCPVAGIYALRGSIAAPGVAFPTGSIVMISHYPAAGGGPYTRSRTTAHRQMAYETLETHCELPLAVGDRVALGFYHEQGSNYTPRLETGNNALDPFSPSMSCWRVSY
jgi:hypothetical protein